MSTSCILIAAVYNAIISSHINILMKNERTEKLSPRIITKQERNASSLNMN